MLLFVFLTSCETSNRSINIHKNYRLKYSNSTTHKKSHSDNSTCIEYKIKK